MFDDIHLAIVPLLHLKDRDECYIRWGLQTHKDNPGLPILASSVAADFCHVNGRLSIHAHLSNIQLNFISPSLLRAASLQVSATEVLDFC
jgi:hypothetical protein